jgi:hypothetical protein
MRGLNDGALESLRPAAQARCPDRGHKGGTSDMCCKRAMRAPIARDRSERVVDERVVDERVVDERVVDERVLDQRVVAERVVAERVVAERVVAERVVAERVVAERVVARSAEPRTNSVPIRASMIRSGWLIATRISILRGTTL